jgi:hypothetical protein
LDIEDDKKFGYELTINSTIEDFKIFQDSMISPAMVLDIMVAEVPTFI